LSELAWAVVSSTLYVAIFALAIALHVVTLLFWCWVGLHFFAR
jgi:hypothetical protein